MKPSANSLNEKTELVPIDLLRIALRRWWVIAAAMCLGGMLGAGLHLLIPPLYQAQAVISTGIDFTRTGDLTDVEEDYMIKQVGDLIQSDAVIEETIKTAAAQGIELDRQAFDEMRFLQRSFNDWLLVIRSRDPQRAAAVSNLWADAAWSSLASASEHLIKLDELQTYLDAQIACRDVQISPETSPACNLASPADISAQIDETLALMQKEQMAAQGLVSGTVFNLTGHAAVPIAPQILGRGTLTLAGSLLGGLLACLFLFVRNSTNQQASPVSHVTE